MSASSFLTSLRIAESVFDLSSDLAPISIRDQIVRASVFMDHLDAYLRPRPSTPRPRIVVAGGGVAGAVCVIQAVAYRFDVVWLEKNGSPFTLQLDSDRWIAPFFYEWPWGPWWATKFPISDTAPLSFTAGISGEIAREWINQYAAVATDPLSKVTYLPNTRIDRWGVKLSTNGRVTVIANYTTVKSVSEEVPGKEVLGKEEGDILILATGVGVERPVGDYKGHSFWAVDPFKRLAARVSPRTRVLISGAGDGALQDFVRICTGINDAFDLYQMLRSQGDAQLVEDIEQNLRATELQSRFSSHLRLEPGCDELTRVDKAYDDAVTQLAADNTIRTLIEGICRTRKGWTVNLVHPCRHLSPIYGINRLLAGLLIKVRSDVRVFSGQGLVRVEAIDGHRCGDPDRCFGAEHKAYVEHRRCGKRSVAGGGGGIYIGDYDVVIPRHGLEPVRPRRIPVQHLLPPHPLVTDGRGTSSLP